MDIRVVKDKKIMEEVNLQKRKPAFLYSWKEFRRLISIRS